MQIGDLVTLSSRGWKLTSADWWLSRNRSRLVSGDEPRESAKSKVVGMITREVPFDAYMVKWLLEDGPQGTGGVPGYNRVRKNVATRWERSHLRYVSKCK